jgi:hypothetical protein
MTRWRYALTSIVLAVACSSNGSSSLYGSESQVYDLSFDSVVIVLQGTFVSVKYVGSDGGDPAVLVVNTADIVDVANSTILLTQLEAGQPRGVLNNVGGGGDGVTNQLSVSNGSVVFDQVPEVGSTLSGQFSATLTNGYTLDGTFSATVDAPSP